MILLLITVALAQEPVVGPEPLMRPVRTADAADDCPAPLAIGVGEQATCVGVVVPPATWAHALEMYAYSDRLEFRVATTTVERDAEREGRRLDRKHGRELTWSVVGGVVAGVGTAMGIAWAYGEIAR